MNHKKIPWWLPQVGSKEERAYIGQALQNNFVNEGPLATEFENRIAALVGVKHAIAVTSCTAGLFLSLKALGIGHGDEVIVPDVTFIATANAVELTGAKAVLADVEPERLTISVEAAKKAITSKTKAIVPVHVTGRAADIEAVLALAKQHDLSVVEDAAEALLSKHNGKCLGTFGIASCFSFSPNKTITTGQGGMIVTDDSNLQIKLRMLKDQGRPVRGTGGDDVHDVIGYNFKLTDIQAGLGLGQLTALEKRIERMKRNYALYREHLNGILGLRVYPTRDGEAPQWTDVETERRDELAAYLKEQNMDSRKYWFPLHRQNAYKLPDDTFPNSTRLSPRSLWLPSAFTLTDEDVLAVCESVRTFFG